MRGISGKIFVNGKRYASYMSPYAKELNNTEISNLIVYVNQEFSGLNKESIPALSNESIQKIREADLPAVKGMSGLSQLNESQSSSAQ